MTGIQTWSVTAANNVNANTGTNWDEGMAPGAVNNSARQNMADLRAAFNDLNWFQYGKGDLAYTPVYLSATQYKIVGADVSAVYHIGRRTKAVGPATGTIYGTISAVSFSTDTSVSVSWDSGSLANEAFTAVALSQLPVAGMATGTGKVVLAASPVLTAPDIGTPSAGTLTNCTGLPVSTGVGGLGAGVATLLAAAASGTGAVAGTTGPTIATPTISGHATIEGVTPTGATGTGNMVFSASPALSGSPTAPTQTAGDNSTKIATTAYVDRMTTYAVRWLGVAGGGSSGGQGGGGGPRGGGGGAGGVREGWTVLVKGTVYSITIGAGGAANSGSNGSNTTGLGFTLLGGGAGAPFSGLWSPGSGGSGGGGAPIFNGGAGNAGNIDQGANGGSSSSGGTTNDNAGGGGGAGQQGGDQVDTPSGNGAGGNGVISAIIPPSIANSTSVGQVVTGRDASNEMRTNVYYGGGGTGGGDGGGGSKPGGLGGGGRADTTTSSNATNGTANTGGGGGGSAATSGGSGVFIIRLPTALYSGTTSGSPTITTDGQDTVLIFKSSGSYTA